MSTVRKPQKEAPAEEREDQLRRPPSSQTTVDDIAASAGGRSCDGPPLPQHPPPRAQSREKLSTVARKQKHQRLG